MSQYKQKFRKEWLKYDDLKIWLEEKVIQKTVGGKMVYHYSEARCKYCNCAINCKLSDLKTHAGTRKHNTNCSVIKSVPKKMENYAKPKNTSLEVHKLEAKFCLFLAEHCPVRISEHLSNFFKEIDVNFQCKRTKSTAIINSVLAVHFQEDLRNDIGDSYYSLLIDESTDISTIKFLGIAIIYFSYSKLRTVYTFLTLKSLVSGDAKSISEAVLAVIDEFGLSLDKFIGVGTDNANVMIGVHNGTHKLLKDVNPKLILIRCICHSLQLATSKACAEFLPRNLEFLIQETYNWFSHSTYRQQAYAEFYSKLNDGNTALKITRVCDTRWLSIETCVTRILSQWNTLKQHFSEVRLGEKCYTAEMLFRMYDDKNNLLYLKFLQPYLVSINKMNKALQMNDVIFLNILEDMILNLKSWITSVILPEPPQKVLSENVFDTPISDIKKVLDPHPRFSHQFETEFQNHENEISKEEETAMRDRCVRFILKLIEEFQARLPENINILRKIGILAPSKALCQVKEDIIGLLTLLNYDTSKISLIDQQWKDIALIPWKNRNDKAMLDFWIEVFQYKDAAGNPRFQELCEAVFALLVLPHSNAEVERIFSTMNIIKTKNRNRMSQILLKSLLIIRYGLKRIQKCCFNYVDNIPEKFIKLIGTTSIYPEKPEKKKKSAPNEAGEPEHIEIDEVGDEETVVEIHIKDNYECDVAYFNAIMDGF